MLRLPTLVSLIKVLPGNDFSGCFSRIILVPDSSQSFCCCFLLVCTSTISHFDKLNVRPLVDEF